MSNDVFENIYDPSSKMPGSTVAPGYIETQKLVVGEIEFDNNDEPSNIVKSISHDFNDNEHTKLPSSRALFEALARVAENIREIDPNANFFRDNTVVTQSLVNEGFDRDEWEITTNWQMLNGVCTFTQNNKENFIKLSSKYFSSIGYYFVVVDVKQIPSGKLKVTNHIYGETLFEISTVGVHYIEFYTSVPDIEYIKIEAVDVFPNDTIVLNKVGLYKVTSRFRNYVNYRLKQLLEQPESAGFITEEHVQYIVDDAIKGLRDYLVQIIDALDDELNIHESNHNNPHKVTTAQIGAANKVHDHTEFSELDLAIQSIAVSLTGHKADFNNPHKVTLKQLGGSPSDHNHDSVYSKLNHNHDGVYTKPNQVTELANTAIINYMNSIAEEEPDPSVLSVYPSTYTLSNPKYLGVHNVNGDKIRSSVPYTPVISKYIIHPDKTDYDFYEGYAYTSELPLTNNPAIYAFKAHLDEKDKSIDCCGFGSTNNGYLDKPVKITYEFFTNRSITGYTIYNDQTTKLNGYVTGWTLIVDDVTTAPVSNSTWTEKGKAGSLTISTGKTLTGKKFTFLITNINANRESQNAGTYNWGFRVAFKFSDVSGDKQLKLPYNLSMTLASALKFDVSNLTVNTAVDESCTPEYLFLKQTSSIKKDADGVKYIEYKPSLILDRIAPEHSDRCTGTAQLMDRYNDAKEHDIFGTISVTNEDVNNPVQNLYKTDLSAVYKTENNVKTTTITHTFINPVNMAGFKFVFDKKDNYPDTWTVKYSRKGNTDVTVSDIDNYTVKYLSPELESNQEVYNCLHDEVYKNVTKVVITFTGTRSQTNLVINQVKLMLSGWYRNYNTGIATDGLMIPLGRIDHYRSDTKNYMGFRFIPNGLGRLSYIPVNNLYKVDTSKQSVFEINNPYQCKDILVKAYMLDNNGNRILATHSHLLITDITVDRITVKALTKNIFVLEVCRPW